MRSICGVTVCLVMIASGCRGSSSPRLDAPEAAADDVPTDTIRAAVLDSAPALQVAEVLRMRGDQDQELFTFIRDVDLSNGEVYVADGLSSHVRIYDMQGKLVRQLGGKGAGPGELEDVFLVAAANDTLFVIDSRGINIFSKTGKYYTRSPINIGLVDGAGRLAVRSFPRTLARTERGLVISQDLNASALQRSVPVSVDTVRLHHLALDGTLGPAIQAIPRAAVYAFARSGRATAHFAPEALFAIAPDGHVLVTDGDGTTFDVYLDGNRERRVRFEVPRRKVTRADLEALFERRYAGWRKPLPASFSVPPDYAQKLNDGHRKVPHYPQHPVVGRLFVSGDVILVNRPDLGGATFDWDVSHEPSRWTALSRSHEVFGTVELPARFSPMTFRDGVILGTIIDEYDVPSIVGYRIGGNFNGSRVTGS